MGVFSEPALDSRVFVEPAFFRGLGEFGEGSPEGGDTLEGFVEIIAYFLIRCRFHQLPGVLLGQIEICIASLKVFHVLPGHKILFVAPYLQDIGLQFLGQKLGSLLILDIDLVAGVDGVQLNDSRNAQDNHQQHNHAEAHCEFLANLHLFTSFLSDGGGLCQPSYIELPFLPKACVCNACLTRLGVVVKFRSV